MRRVGMEALFNSKPFMVPCKRIIQDLFEKAPEYCENASALHFTVLAAAGARTTYCEDC
jgi:hypothetical protein